MFRFGLVAGLEIKREICGISHLAKNERDMGHPEVRGRDTVSTRSFSGTQRDQHLRIPLKPKDGLNGAPDFFIRSKIKRASGLIIW
jgi:hypothetical protein